MVKSLGAAKSVIAANGKRFWNSLRPINSETRQYFGVRPVRLDRAGRPEHRERVLDALDQDFLVERVIVHILVTMPEMTDAAGDRVIDRVARTHAWRSSGIGSAGTARSKSRPARPSPRRPPGSP